jgi:hypothetical protein
MSPSANSRPAASPSDAARPKRVGMAMSSAALYTAGREPDDDGADRRGMLIGLRGVDERQRSSSPAMAKTTATRSAPRSRDGWPRAVLNARTTTGRRHGLHQRERRQPQGRHVHQPARALAPNAISQRRSRSSTWADRKGRRGESGGSRAAASCSSE